MGDNIEIYCDVYGSDVDPTECEHCSMKKDCMKIKLKNNPNHIE